MSIEDSTQLETAEATEAGAPDAAPRRPLAAVAFAAGAQASLLGVAVGAALGWFAAAQSEDGSRDAGESALLGAMFIGLLFAPAVASSARLARVWPHDWSGSAAGILGRGTAGPALAGMAWGAAGSVLVFAFGSLAGVEFVFTSILLLGAGLGLVAGSLLGLVVTLVRMTRHRTASD